VLFGGSLGSVWFHRPFSPKCLLAYQVEELLTSAPQSYKRPPVGSSDTGIVRRCRRYRLRSSAIPPVRVRQSNPNPGCSAPCARFSPRFACSRSCCVTPSRSNACCDCCHAVRTSRAMLFRSLSSRCFAACVCRSAVFARALYKNPLNTGILIFTPTAPYQFGKASLRTGATPHRAQRAHRGPPQVMFRVAEFFRRSLLIL